MKLANEAASGVWAPAPEGLDGLIARLEVLSLGPLFATQRDLALRQALSPYVEGEAAGLLQPFAHEVELAALIVYADFYPQDGQLTLIEQLRDVVTEHIPESERVWMDPLKHSYMDVVEVMALDRAPETMTCRSLGDRRVYEVRGGEFCRSLEAGQVLLTRLVQLPGNPETNEVVIGEAALVLSGVEGRALYEATGEYRRQMEISAGSFELGDWHEFAKRFGHVLLWLYAQMRQSALLKVVATIRYRVADGQPHLYALALYEHHEFRYLRDTLATLEGFEPAPSPAGSQIHGDRWIMKATAGGEPDRIVARLSLTPTQLWVQTDSRERLDAVKHQLAATFGFSLHFRGEATTPAPHLLTFDELNAEGPLRVVVTADQDAAVLKDFLDIAYLEWTDRDAPILGGKTPRHAATSPAGREQVGRLIDEMERHDPGWARIGRPAFDYNVLRGHVGLDEVSREHLSAERAP